MVKSNNNINSNYDTLGTTIFRYGYVFKFFTLKSPIFNRFTHSSNIEYDLEKKQER